MIFLTILLFLFSDTCIKKSNSVQLPCTTIRDSTNCICFPGDDSHILSMLDPQGHGLERLVVYLYRDVVSNQIFTLIPDPAKQLLFPNIPIDRTDKLNHVTIELIASLIHENPNFLVKPSNINTEYENDPVLFPVNTNPVIINPVKTNPVIINPIKVNAVKINPIKSKPYQYNSQQALMYPGEATLWAKYNTFSGRHTFNQWFDLQMQRFQRARSIHEVHAINLEAIRVLVRKTLLENRIYVGSNGLLEDDSGTPINFNNLELRSILISNPVIFQDNNQANEVILPKDLPYLEGILLTFINPPKTLGIIPLGKTYLGEHNRQIMSHSQYYSNLQRLPLPYTASDTEYNLNTMNIVNQNQQLSPEIIEYLISETDGSRNSPETNKKTNDKTQTPEPNNKNNIRRKKSIDEEAKSLDLNSDANFNQRKGSWRSPNVVFIPLNTYGHSSRPIRNDYPRANVQPYPNPDFFARLHEESDTDITGEELDIPDNELNESIESEDVVGKDEDMQGRTGNRKHKRRHHSSRKTLKALLKKVQEAYKRGIITNPGQVKIIELDEGPDFRIIGGNSATGSGSPVSSKGRSGVNII